MKPIALFLFLCALARPSAAAEGGDSGGGGGGDF